MNKSSEFFCLWYARAPHDFSSTYDICGGKFNITHALTCKSGGLIIAWHNEMCWKIIHNMVPGLSPSSIRDEPLIFWNRGQDSSTFTPHQLPKKKIQFHQYYIFWKAPTPRNQNFYWLTAETYLSITSGKMVLMLWWTSAWRTTMNQHTATSPL